MKKLLLLTLILPCLTMGASARPIAGNRAAESKHTTPMDAIQAAETIKGTVKDAPARDDVAFPVEEAMVVEYYSR